MSKRFQTYFGIPLPPWKEEPIGAGSTTIRFVLKGSIPSKKNNTMAVAVRLNARNFLFEALSGDGVITKSAALNIALKAIKMVYAKIRPNKAYIQFVKEQKPFIRDQMESWAKSLQQKGLVFPLTKATMTLRFYFHARYVQDTVNKQQSIQDLLHECGVIMNDDYLTLNPIHSASACYYEEIVESLSWISLSFKL